MDLQLTETLLMGIFGQDHYYILTNKIRLILKNNSNNSPNRIFFIFEY